MTMRILHLEPECYAEALLERLREIGPVDLLANGERASLLRCLEETSYEAIFVRLGCSVDRTVFYLQPGLRFVVTPTTGLNHIDLEEADRRGIRIVSLAGETAFLDTIRSTAEHTWALLLALVRGLPLLTQGVLRGQWQRTGAMAGELAGKTLGIVGYGRLGRMVAGYGAAFGMHVLVHDRDSAVSAIRAEIEHSHLDELLAASDVVSLHITGSAENRKFLDGRRIRRMKPGAVLINTARGEIVDEVALLAALEAGHLGGAALDVLDGDSSWEGSIPEDHPLLAYARSHDNLIITPHSGGYGRSSIERTRTFVTERFITLCGAPRRIVPPPHAKAST
jgi:D-3-phosphoglycerate dehydrogenase / 2-oxoglutarate reductase